MLRSRQFLIGIIVSVLFLFWALSNENLAEVGKAILNQNYWALIPALGLYFIGVWVRAWRWRILLKPIAPKVTLGKTFEVVVIGYMANDVLPARIGELVRAYVLSKREGVRKTATLATILIERIFDGLVMVGFAAAVILIVTTFDRSFLSTGPQGRNLGNLLVNQQTLIGLLAIGFLAVLVAFISIASSRSRAERTIDFALRFFPGRLRERGKRLADSFIDGLGSLRSASGLAAVFGLSIVAWLFEASMYYVLGTWGFNLRTDTGASVPFYAYVLATAFANLSTLIPQAPGFLGVFDAIAKAVFVSAFGVDSGRAISYVLVLHAALLLPITLLGFVYLWRESLSWSELTGLEKSRSEAAGQAHELEGPLTDIELVGEGKIIEGDSDVPVPSAMTVSDGALDPSKSGESGAAVAEQRAMPIAKKEQ